MDGPVIIDSDLIALMTPDELAEYETYLQAEQQALTDQDMPVDWREQARDAQLPPEVAWLIWLILGGRGGGKTWTGSNALAELIQSNPPGEWAVIAPTYGDARDTCIESGESGLLTALGLPRTYDGWNRSMGELRLPNGAVVYADGADDGALRVQGKNLRGAWCDEIGLWKRWQVAWDESLMFAVRKAPAKIIATGTPKRNMPAIKLIRRLLADVKVPRSVLRTEDNAANLHPAMLAELMTLAGTALGMQELEGAVLDEIAGGYFNRADWRYHDFDPMTRMFDLAGQRYALDDSERFITIDLAASLRTSADWTVASAWAITLGGELVLLDRVRARVAETDHAEFIEPLRERWLGQWDTTWVEASMQSSTLAYDLGRSGVPWQPLRADKDKITRAIPYVKLVRKHRVWLPKDAPWLEEWLDEHEQFGNDQVHDDQVDTGAYATRVVLAHWLRPETALEEQARGAWGAPSTEEDLLNLTV